MKRSLVVSIHDVSPYTMPEVQPMLADLAELGIHETSLLVIPDHHERGHFLAHPSFCEWLQTNVRIGHEAIIHGYTHRRARRAKEGAVDKFITQLYTADEGEFYDLSESEALSLIQRAQFDFARLNLTPSGFIAPAWLLSAGSERALKAAGIQHTTRLGTFYDLAENRIHRSQSLVYSTRAAWRRLTSLAWNASLAWRLQRNPLLRLSIHPGDWHHPAIWKQIRKLARAALADRECMTYERWLALSRHGQS